MGDHKPVLLKFKLPVQRPSSGKEEASVKSSVQATDDQGKEQQPAQDEKSALGNEANRIQNNFDRKPNNNSRRSKKRNKRKNSQRKPENQRPQVNSVSNSQNSQNKANDVRQNNTLNDISNSLSSKTSNHLISHEKNGLNDGQFDLKDKDKRLPPLPLRTMSIPELSNETIKTKRLLLTDKKNHSTSFDQEKMKPTTIHNQEWFQKTQKLFDYSKYEAQGDLKNLQETSDLGKLRKDSLNENYCSSRLTSHHSSSSEEWYREIHEKMHKAENKRQLKSVDDLNSANIAINNLESNQIVSQLLSLQDEREKEKVNEARSEPEPDKEADGEATAVDQTGSEETNEKIAEQEKTSEDVEKVEDKRIDEPAKATNEPEEKIEKKSEPVESTESEKPLETVAEIRTNHSNHTNHTDPVGPPTKEQPTKKKKKRLLRIGKKCVLMYISPSYLSNII